MSNKYQWLSVGATLAAIALAALAFYLWQQNSTQAKAVNMLLEERNYFLLETSSSTNALRQQEAAASSTITSLSTRLQELEDELSDTERDLKREQDRNEDFSDQIKKISGTVGILDKLSKTDEELLQKYSKTYFLNENFVPMKLGQIKSKYILAGKKDQYFHGNAIEFLYDMLDEAADDGIDLKVISAYRSFDEQADLKGQYSQVYGTGANTFSADQGYSEHQLGTTLDLTDPATGGTYNSFADTEAYAWLLDNAYRFGFIISYPPSNSFYIYEPWHWRFVGTDLARDLRKDKATFYDWDQRKIDEYLVNIFD